MSWPSAPRRGGSQKGAETRPGSEATRHPADARRDDHHRDAPALLVLRPHRRAGPRPDHGQPDQANPPRGDQRQDRGRLAADTEEWVNETHQAFLTMIRSHWRGWNPVLFEDRASQHKSPSSLA